MFKAGAPFTDETYPERESDCALALAPAFLSLMDLAQMLGWRRQEAAMALATLAGNHLRADQPKPVHGLQRIGVHLAGG